jgi:hypothetical protein
MTHCASLGCPWIFRAATNHDGSVRVYFLVFGVYFYIFTFFLVFGVLMLASSIFCRFRRMKVCTLVLPGQKWRVVQWCHRLGWKRGQYPY